VLRQQDTIPFSSSNCKAQPTFELVHFDIYGPMDAISIEGFDYFLTFIDEFS
jgi:hypothetical protein